jgi:hypothetical protein
MSSNYPPGVTGNEYAIAGPDNQYEEELICGAKDVEYFTLSSTAVKWINSLIAEVGKEQLTKQRIVSRLQAVDAEIEKVEGDCPFAGAATVTEYRRERWWTCPLCRTEQAMNQEE